MRGVPFGKEQGVGSWARQTVAQKCNGIPNIKGRKAKMSCVQFVP